MCSLPPEPGLHKTKVIIIFFHLQFHLLDDLHVKEVRRAQKYDSTLYHHLPLGKANTLMIRKKKTTERMPFQMLSSGTRSSLKIEKQQ
jgi:hypothetical protein